MATPIQVLRSVSSSLAQVRKEISDTRSELVSLDSQAQSSQAGLRGVVDAGAAAVESAGRGSASAQQVLAEVQKLTAAADAAVATSRDHLGELSLLLQNSTNIWDQQVLALIDSIKVGAAPVELLIAQFGEAVIQGKRLTEFLDGANLHQYRDEVRELVRDLQGGKADVDEALKLLGESQLAIAKKLKETIDLFRQGKVSLEFVAQLVEQIQRAMPDSDFADLAEAIEDALRKGDL